MRRIGWTWVALAVVGCADESTTAKVAQRNYSLAAARAVAPAEPTPKSAPDAEAPTTPSATAGRKIIYNARVVLVTEDLAKFDATLAKLIEARKAYVADSERTGSAGANRRGSWRVRVPVEAYDAFVAGVVKLGELVSLKADSQDVSEEFYDLEAREKAKAVEEQRLLKHLADSTGKLEEILNVERELSRVRSEIERMQGRLRALGNLTTLATVTITASEIKDYVPPQAPTFGTRLARSFSGSVDALRTFGESALIACVAVVPWLPLIALGFGIAYLVVRRLIARPRVMMIDDIPPPPARR